MRIVSDPPGFSGKKSEAMKKIKILFLILFSIVACTPTVRIKSTEAASGFALPQYQTFNFYEIKTDSAAPDQPFLNRIDILKNAIRRELTAKGLTLSPDNPDLLVNIGIFTREKVQTRQTDFRTDAPKYMGQRRYSWKSQEVEVGRYREGTVTVHLVDREKNAMVWKGVAEAIIPKKEERLQKTVEAGVAKLFSRL
jgi:hypothetical protein